MEDIVALCRRRGFIFQSSEIYGGINGFWDYGPLGVSLKRNLKNAWWNDVVERELIGPDGDAVHIVGLDSSIIMNPKTWVNYTRRHELSIPGKNGFLHLETGII